MKSAARFPSPHTPDDHYLQRGDNAIAAQLGFPIAQDLGWQNRTGRDPYLVRSSNENRFDSHRLLADLAGWSYPTKRLL